MSNKKKSGFSITTTAIDWTGSGEYLRVEAWGRNSVRVRSSMMRPCRGEDWALSCQIARETPEIVVQENCATLVNGRISVRLAEIMDEKSGICSCRLSFFRDNEELLFSEIGSGGSLLLKARKFEAVAGDYCRLEASFTSDPEEHLYGMGEYQGQTVDLKGSSFELAHRNSQASVPFVVSSRKFGFLWNNPSIGRAHFSRNSTIWISNETRALDYWVTTGEEYSEILENYADVTGHCPSMPEWALGFWQCKLRYWNQEQVLGVAREFFRRGIPLSVIVIDFFHWPRMGDFRFEEEFWPDPSAMCRELHSMGIKVFVSVWPQIALTSENYFEMKASNYLVKANEGVDVGMSFVEPSQFFDATNPAARQFVWEKCKQNYLDYGIDGFWLDEAEPEWSTYSFNNYQYFKGSVNSVGNLYPKDYNQTFYSGLLDEGREGEIVNLTRCAWAGSQKFGSLVWSGDVGSTFADLRSQISCAINMGMAGIPWFTTDMGGFHDGIIDSPRFQELLIRWCEFSCFSPIMRNHGDRSLKSKDGKEEVHANDGTIRLPSGADNEPWSFGQEVEKCIVKYIQIREILKPYLAKLFLSAHTKGEPLVRGLFFDFPGDAACHSVQDEYMFGPDLLVAPVITEGAREREVYLPGSSEVSWTNVVDGKTYSGGTAVGVSAPLDVIPVFARNGQAHGLNGTLWPIGS